MTILASDELQHPAGPSPHWNESYWFPFSDSGGSWAGFTRVGISPPRGTRDALVCLFFPDGSAGILLSREPFAAGDPVIRAGGLAYECLDPLRRWRVRYEGEVFHVADLGLIPFYWDHGLFDLPRRRVALDLTFEALHDAVDFHFRKQGSVPLRRQLARLRDPRTAASLLSFPRRLGQALRMGQNRHYQQTGSMSGYLVVDGERVDLVGASARDHSWGIRDWTLPRRWRWFSAQFDGRMAFSVHRLELLGSILSAGYLWRGGRTLPLAGFEIEGVLDAGASSGQPVRILLRTEGGETLDVAARLVRSVAVPVRDGGTTQLIGEGYARFEWEGRSSFGFSEIAERVDA